jgi:hypothetical protein
MTGGRQTRLGRAERGGGVVAMVVEGCGRGRSGGRPLVDSIAGGERERSEEWEGSDVRNGRRWGPVVRRAVWLRRRGPVERERKRGRE